MLKTIFTLLCSQPDECVGDNFYFHTCFEENLKNWISPEIGGKDEPQFQGVEGYHLYHRQKSIILMCRRKTRKV